MKIKFRIKTKIVKNVLLFTAFTFALFIAAIFKDNSVPEIQNLKENLIAFAGNLGNLAQNLSQGNIIPISQPTDYTNIDVEDVFNRCTVNNGDIDYPSRVNYLSSKIGYNPAEEIAGRATSDQYKDYFRGKNEQGIDLHANFLVAVAVKDGDDGINTAVDFVKGAVEDGFLPVIRLCYEQQGNCDFDLSQNENELVDYYQGISDRLKASGGNYVFAATLGPNEPLTGDPGMVLSSFKVPNYETFIIRANEAADRLQGNRVENGGNMFLAPAIFNISQKEDAPRYLDLPTPGNGDESVKIRPELFDFIALNAYSDIHNDAYHYYQDSEVPQYVAEHDLVTLVTETGLIGISAHEPAFGTTKKAQFLAMEKFCADDRVEGISFFRNIKEFGEIEGTVESWTGTEEERLEFNDYLRLAESCQKGSKRMSLKNTVWLDCPVDTATYSKVSDTSETVQVASLTASSKIGLNMARGVGAFDLVKSDMQFAKSNAIGGYIIELTTDPGSVDHVASFVNEANSQGVTPIVRLCYDGACGFNLSQSAQPIIDFYTALDGKVSGSYVAMLGPNEPGTGGGPEGFGELKGFGISDYATAVRRANEAAEALQGLQHALLAPAAFNLINTQNDDYNQYINNGLNPALFDVLIGNAYDEGTKSAYQVVQEKGILQYASSNNLKVIITETGQINNSSTNFIDTAAQMCADPTIAGILLFRSFAEINPKISVDPNSPGGYSNVVREFSNQELKEIGAACGGSVVVGGGDNGGGVTGGISSDILACGVEDDRDASFYAGKNGAALKVSCASGVCETRSIGTIQVEMSIKFMSSTASFGTLRNRVTPQAFQTALDYAGGIYNPLNYVAEEIQVGDVKYPMPGLGTYYNAVEIGKVKGFERFLDVVPDPNEGALFSKKGIETEIDNNLAVPTVSGSNVSSTGIGPEGNVLSSSSNTTCINGRCYNHETEAGTEILKTLIPANPFTANTTIKTSNMCSQPIKYVNNLDDYVTGPEIVVSQTTEYSKSSAETCWRYSRRYIDTPDGINLVGDGLTTCGYDQEAQSPDQDKPDGFETVFDPLGQPIFRQKFSHWTCGELFEGVGTNSLGQTLSVPGGPRLPKCDFTNAEYEQAQLEGRDFPQELRDGYCNIDRKYIQCMKYDQQDSDQLYVYTNSYPSIGKVNAKDFIKELSVVYQKTKEGLPPNRKLIFPEEDILGMKVNVNAIIRDANSTNNNEEYIFATQYSDKGTHSNMFDGKSNLAKNNPIKSQSQMLELAGTANVLREIESYYSSAADGYAERMKDDPFNGTANDPNPDRDKILVGGTSNVLLPTRPLLTCDQVNICKNYTFSDLKSQFGYSDTVAFELCPLNKKLEMDKMYMCITDEKDDRYKNDLEDKLCEYGSDSKDCIRSCVPPTPAPGGTPDVSGIEGVQCPLADTRHSCYQGAYSTWTHDASNDVPNHLALDMNPEFGNNGASPRGRDMRLVAPEDGTVGTFKEGYGPNGFQGHYVTFQGKSGVTYRFLHLTVHRLFTNPSSTDRIELDYYRRYEGQFVEAGTVIAELGSLATAAGKSFAYGDGDIHTHVTVSYDGVAADPYFVYGDILGCNVARPDNSIVENTLVGMNNNYCKAYNGGAGKLQDNNPNQIKRKHDLQQPLDNAVIGNLFVNTYKNGSGGSVEGGQSFGQDLTLFPVTKSRPIPMCVEPAAADLEAVTALPNVNDDVDEIRLTKTAAAAFNEMVGAMESDPAAFNSCAVSWGYRSAEQQGEFADECTSGTACKCHSEHQLGTTIDFRVVDQPNNQLAFAGSACSNWLVENAHKYGFVQSYRQGHDEYIAEPWHYRYIGKTYAEDFIKNLDQFKQLDNYLESKLINGQPGTPNPSTQNNYNSALCAPGGKGNELNGNTKNIFEVIENVSQVTGIDKYYLTAILTLESSPQMGKSVGSYIRDGTAHYKTVFDKADGAEANPNSASAQGPMQFICRTWMSYGYPSDYSGPRPCEPWSAGSMGRYYKETLACANALGMEIEDGTILDRNYLGVSLCAGAIKLKLGVNTDPITNFDVRDRQSFSNINGFWNNAVIYNYGGGNSPPPITLWYADSAWGRAHYFMKYWEEYKSGEMGDDGIRGWYYYHKGLDLPFCIDRGAGNQCSVSDYKLD